MPLLWLASNVDKIAWYMRIYIYTHAHTSTYIYAYIETHIHIYTDTYCSGKHF